MPGMKLKLIGTLAVAAMASFAGPAHAQQTPRTTRG
jgi:hypothetical protein